MQLATNVRTPISADFPILAARYCFHSSDTIRLYPERSRNPAHWTVAGPNCPNEVWIRREHDRTGYTVSHRHSGGCFPRLFAPLAFEVLESPRWGHKSTQADTFTEAYALAVQLVRAYGAR